MSAEPNTIQIDPGSELGRILGDAAERGTVLEQAGVRYRLIRLDMLDADDDDDDDDLYEPPAPERLLNIIGRGASKEETDVARFKHQYIADAVDHRG